MKKLIIAFAVLTAVVFGAALILPVIFKDDIKTLVEKELNNAVEADIYFDVDKFSLSLLANFPHFTVELGDFGIINREPFDGEVLFAAEHFRLVVNLWSVVFGPQPKVNAIILDNVRVNVRVLEDGTANYDITKAIEPDTEQGVEPEIGEQTTNFSIAIDKWRLSDVNVVYDDQSTKSYLKIEGLTHTGRGDFTQDIFDLTTKTVVNNIIASYDGVTYLSNKSLDVGLTLNMNLPESKYTFKENTIKVNDFGFGFDGDVVLGEEYELDLTFQSKENTFKSILSLVPGMYTEEFDQLKTEGVLQFGGRVKGVYNDSLQKLPAFNLELNVSDAMFSYPEVPGVVDNIEINLKVDNHDGIIENTIINLSKFHLDFANNPVDATLVVENLKNYPIDASVNAHLNLEELTDIFPMEGLDLRGLLDINASAKGYYDSVTNVIPKIDLKATLSKGYVKYQEYPVPLEDIHFTTLVKNTTGKLNDTELNINDFVLLLEGEKLQANLGVFNLEDPQWEAHVHGVVDLGKLTKIFPQEGMTLAGKIKADLDTKGQLSDLEAERYDKLPTNGAMVVTGFSYFDEANLPMGFKIAESELTFNPDKLDLKKFEGSVGKSDLNLNGYISNYLGFVMSDQQVLRGKFNFSSNTFDANEWMTDSAEETPTEENSEDDTDDTTAIEPVEIPRNIDFVLNSKINKVLYDNLVLNNANGDIMVRDGQLILDDLSFKALNGLFAMSGSYDSRDITEPKFDFKFGIKELDIPMAYQSFSTIKAAAPIARNMEGNFSTDFKLAGSLTEEMLPDYPTLQGSGFIEIAEAAIKGSKALDAVNKVTSLGFAGVKQVDSDKSNVNIKDLMMKTQIRNGRVFISPTEFTLGGYETTLSGSTGLAGDLDLVMDMEIPAGAAGQAFNQAVSSFLGKGDPGSSNVNLKLGIQGTQDNPSVKILGTSMGSSEDTKKAVTEAAADEALDKLGIGGEDGESAEERLQKEADKQKEEAKKKAEEEARKKQKELEEKLKKEKEEAAKKLKKIFGK